MPRLVTIQYDKCHPSQCSAGICSGAVKCKRKIIHQEEAYEYPMVDTANCAGCSDCMDACPSGAIKVITI